MISCVDQWTEVVEQRASSGRYAGWPCVLLVLADDVELLPHGY